MVCLGVLVRCFSSFLSSAHVAFRSLSGRSVVVVGWLSYTGFGSTAQGQVADMLMGRYDYIFGEINHTLTT